MEKSDKQPTPNMWEAGMLDPFIRGMWWQIKNEAETIYPKTMDKTIRAFRIHEFLVCAEAYIVHLGESEIYCRLNNMTNPRKKTLTEQIKVWLEFKRHSELHDMDMYFKDRALEVAKEIIRLKKEEEDCKDE